MLTLPVRSDTFFASEFATAFAISVFPHPGGPYSKIPFGAGSLYSAKSSRYRYGSSTASVIASIWVVEPSDVGVADIGHFLEDDLFHLGTWQLFEKQTGARIHENRIPCPQLDA